MGCKMRLLGIEALYHLDPDDVGGSVVDQSKNNGVLPVGMVVVG